MVSGDALVLQAGIDRIKQGRTLSGRRLSLAAAGCAAVAVLSVLTLSFYQPRCLIGAASAALPDILFAVKTERPLVALTFDDGPDSTVTPRVLEILQREHVLATWFVNGSAVAQHPDQLRAIVAGGHQLANHMWDRTPAWTLTPERLAASVEATAAAVPGSDMRTMLRPASGWIRPSSADWTRRKGYRIILGSVYANDPLKPPPQYLTWAIVRMAQRGDIVVLHVGAGRERTAEALPGMIKGLRAKGLRFVRLSELLDSATATSQHRTN
ncbi:MAG: polysaccharide deacetylase family protein [Gemmatimonadaceae bacterium]